LEALKDPNILQKMFGDRIDPEQPSVDPEQQEAE
jgi:hypothetical protein